MFPSVLAPTSAWYVVSVEVLVFGAGSYFCRVREVLVVGVSFGAGPYYCRVRGVSRRASVRCWLLLLQVREVPVVGVSFGAGSYFCRVREVLVVGVSFGAGSYFCRVRGISRRTGVQCWLLLLYVSRYWWSVLASTSAGYVVSVDVLVFGDCSYLCRVRCVSRRTGVLCWLLHLHGM